MSKEKLTAEIMYLSALVNANTELCVFVRYSGHVDVLDVDIAESKENFKSRIFEADSRLDSKKGMESLERVRGELISILTDHKIPYETLVFNTQEVVNKEAVPDSASDDPGLTDRVATLEKEMAELKRLVSSQLEERGAADVSEELPSSRGDRHANGDRLEDRLQKAL